MAGPNTVDIYIAWASITFSGGDTLSGGNFEVWVDSHFQSSITPSSVNSTTIPLSYPGTHLIEVKSVDYLTKLRSQAAATVITIGPRGETVAVITGTINLPKTPFFTTLKLVSLPYYATVIVELTEQAIASLSSYFITQSSSMGASPTSSNYSNGQYKNFSLPSDTSPLQYSEDYPLGSQIHIEVTPQNTLGANIGGPQVYDFTVGETSWPGPVSLDIPLTQLISNIVATAASGEDPPSNQIGIVCGTDTPPTDPVTIQFGVDGPLYTFPDSAFFTSPQTFTFGPLFDFFYEKPTGIYEYYITDPAGEHIQARGTLDFAAHD